MAAPLAEASAQGIQAITALLDAAARTYEQLERVHEELGVQLLPAVRAIWGETEDLLEELSSFRGPLADLLLEASAVAGASPWVTGMRPVRTSPPPPLLPGDGTRPRADVVFAQTRWACELIERRGRRVGRSLNAVAALCRRDGSDPLERLADDITELLAGLRV